MSFKNEPTNTTELKHIAHNIGVNVTVFNGKNVFNLEDLKNGNYIVNYADINKPGTHWACFIVKPKNRIEYFSSFGDLPLKQFENPRYHVVYNNIQLQAFDSKMCGLYCLAFLYLRKHGTPFKTIVDSYFYHNDEAGRMENNKRLSKLLREFEYKNEYT